MNRRTFLTWMGVGGLASISPILIGAILAKRDRFWSAVAQSERNESETTQFYIAPNGKDKWSGKLANPNPTQTDGPFATLERARNAIRQLKSEQGGSLQQPVNIVMRTGNYFLARPLVLTDEDSGTDDAPVTYSAYKNETPVISGGRIIKGWKEETVNGKTMWTVTLPGVRAGKWYFQHLWVNGERRTRSRYPNKGYLQVEVAPDAAGKSWKIGQNRFKFKEGDLQAWPSISKGGEAVVMTRWVDSRLPIVAVNESQRIISFSKKSVWRIDPNALYYLENIFETLDTPGEWYLNRSTGKLYYIPMPGEDINTIEAIAPTLTFLVILKGEPKADKYVKYINFERLAFSHTNWRLPAKVSGFVQNALGVPGAIYGVGVQHCNWEQCKMSHLGTHAIELFRGCQYNNIVECEMFDLGAGGIKIGERVTPLPKISDAEATHHNEVINNHIYDGGYFFPSAVAVRAVHSNHNLIAQNHIHDFYYMGISVRGVWGYQATRSHNNIIEFNYIHDIGKLSNGEGPILDDLSAIYTLGLQPGTIVRSNVIHDIKASKNKGWGIYLDEGSSQIVVENNLVYRTTSGGFHLHYGKENIIRNNIFAFGEIAQIRRTRNENHLSFTFENNIVYWDTGKLLEGKWDDYNYFFDRNLYWQVNNEAIRFNGLSWEQWQAKGMDENSRITEPLFVAPERGNFQLKSSSPAFQLGFESIETGL